VQLQLFTVHEMLEVRLGLGIKPKPKGDCS
jgi:hypothetical protein